MGILVLRIGLAVLLALVLPPPVGATPVISGDFLFTENRGSNPVLPSGWTFVLGATSITPAGASTTAFAKHVPSASGPDFTLNFIPGPLLPNQYGIALDYTGQIGQWDMVATDGTGPSAPTRTHPLDHPAALPIITGLTASGSLLTPHLTWHAVNPAMFPSFCSQPGSPSIFPPCVVGNDFYNYQVEVRRITDTPGNPAPLVFTSTGIPTSLPGTLTTTPTVFDIPPGVLTPGNRYLLGIRLNNTELETILEPFPNPRFFSPLENRSTAYLELSTVPAPSALTLLVIGATLGTVLRTVRRPQSHH